MDFELSAEDRAFAESVRRFAATAREMLVELPGATLLQGHRGRARGDVDALITAIVRLSHLALADAPQVLEAEINPLLVMEEGCGAFGLDALVRGPA